MSIAEDKPPESKQLDKNKAGVMKLPREGEL